MVYYPLSVLMLAGVREILLISTPTDIDRFKELLGTGNELGLSIEYQVQEQPRGIAEAFILDTNFIGQQPVWLILGDNFFYGHDIEKKLSSACSADRIESHSATIFGYPVSDPGRYGVVSFSNENKVAEIEEKPEKPKSNIAVTGLYFYPASVVDIVKSLKPSARGELEITDVNREYVKRNQLHVEIFGRGFAWLDAGTHDSMLEASNFVQIVQKRQGLNIACIEEIAYRKNYIDKAQLMKLASLYGDQPYGNYLRSIAEKEK